MDIQKIKTDPYDPTVDHQALHKSVNDTINAIIDRLEAYDHTIGDIVKHRVAEYNRLLEENKSLHEKISRQDKKYNGLLKKISAIKIPSKIVTKAENYTFKTLTKGNANDAKAQVSHEIPSGSRAIVLINSSHNVLNSQYYREGDVIHIQTHPLIKGEVFLASYTIVVWKDTHVLSIEE